MNQEEKKQFTLRIVNANKSQLIVVLYDILFVYLKDVRNAYEKQDKECFQKDIKRAKACVLELIKALNLRYEVAVRLLELYDYITHKLRVMEARYQIKDLNEVETILKELYEAFLEMEKKDASEPLMENVQNVYAGLTYGKTKLTENYGNTNENRGFFV